MLANEQVINGRCERCDTVVEQRTLEQWFFRITEYADRLLADLDDKSKMDWSDSTTTAQRNWLGRSEGAELDFPLGGGARPTATRRATIRVFTTRPDTVFGATFMVLAPEHPLVDRLIIGRRSGRRWTRTARRPRRRTWSPARWASGRRPASSPAATRVNPATGQQIPVWIADYVLMEYGTGAIMAVPGHDERDFEFAAKFGLPIVRVVAPDRRVRAEPDVERQGDGDPGELRRRSRSPTTRAASWSTRASSTA